MTFVSKITFFHEKNSTKGLIDICFLNNPDIFLTEYF